MNIYSHPYPQLFLDNKYTKWYFSIIFNAIDRTLPQDTYVEKHHIIPKCMAGSNEKANLIKLTAREHFICHMLLPKMVEGKIKYKLMNAATAMSMKKNINIRSDLKITSRQFQTLKEYSSQANKERAKHEDRSGVNNNNYGHTWNEEQRNKMRGHTRNVGRKPKPVTEGERLVLKASAKKRADRQVKEGKSNIQSALDFVYVCENCGKSGKGKTNYIRWHGDKCPNKS